MQLTHCIFLRGHLQIAANVISAAGPGHTWHARHDMRLAGRLPGLALQVYLCHSTALVFCRPWGAVCLCFKSLCRCRTAAACLALATEAASRQLSRRVLDLVRRRGRLVKAVVSRLRARQQRLVCKAPAATVVARVTVAYVKLPAWMEEGLDQPTRSWTHGTPLRPDPAGNAQFHTFHSVQSEPSCRHGGMLAPGLQGRRKGVGGESRCPPMPSS